MTVRFTDHAAIVRDVRAHIVKRLNELDIVAQNRDGGSVDQRGRARRKELETIADMIDDAILPVPTGDEIRVDEAELDARIRAGREPGEPEITITVRKLKLIDDGPDVSWLTQTDEQMGEGFEAESARRLESYNDGQWCCVGVRVVAEIERDGFSKTIESGGVWGIESDSGPSYFDEIADDEWAEIRDEVVRHASPDDADGAFADAGWSD